MNKWDQAAKVSMCSIGQLIQDEYCDAYNGQIVSSVSQQEIVNHISKAHADLRRVYGKLVELAKTVQRYYPISMGDILADPDIQAAIQKGEEG